ncbi:MAG: TetR/AcrR family transcriptional regulator [Myxococcales bacterium]|nr:TetR/AcrR family transcriptional regulator [Myxococcales bacterium]
MGRCSDARDRLLATAAQLVHERGYTAVSVADICKEAGLKKGSFYHFFRSKHALILATLDRFAELHEANMEKAMGSGISAREQLLSMATGLVRGFRMAQQTRGSMHGCPLGNITQEMAHRDEELRAKLADIFTRWQRGLARMLERARGRQELAVRDPHRAAEAIIAYLQGGILLTKATDDPEVLLRLGHGIVALAEADLPMLEVSEVPEDLGGSCQIAQALP